MDNSTLSAPAASASPSFDYLPESLVAILHFLAQQFHRLPGSTIFMRYVRSSHQNDPVRSALELFLVLFAIRYLLASKYSTKPGKVVLSEDVSVQRAGLRGAAESRRSRRLRLEVKLLTEFGTQEIDDLVEDWTPEPLVGKVTPFEEQELEKRAVIVGCVNKHCWLPLVSDIFANPLQPDRPSLPPFERPHRHKPRLL